MNNVSSVHNCAEHQNQQCGLGTAFDSLSREKYVYYFHTYNLIDIKDIYKINKKII